MLICFVQAVVGYSLELWITRKSYYGDYATNWFAVTHLLCRKDLAFCFYSDRSIRAWPLLLEIQDFRQCFAIIQL